MNKYALFRYSNSNNVGDEIQSIAARRFLPKIDYYIDRDSVGLWQNDNQNETVKLIANGWYMHEPYAWPVIDKTIEPLLVSMHVNETDQSTIERFSSKESRSYMNSFGPVGARDNTTRALLEGSGVNTYFSACMTLTLQRDRAIKKQDYILAVSVSDDVYEFIKKNTNKRVIRFNPYVNRGIDNTEKTKIAEYILFFYQSAACVVTTKIHAMLPSLALGTSVLFVDDNEGFDPSRFDGLAEFIRSTGKKDLLAGRYEYDFNKPPRNLKNHESYRNDLIKRGEEFTGYKDNRSFVRTIDISKIEQDKVSSKIPTTDKELSASELVSYVKPPMFSIIMPAYNIGAYITDAVTSIKNQIFTDFECIIVDDGSTDKGVDSIVNSIRDDVRFRVITQKNGGLSNARNNGYKVAKGDYVLFLDGDDLFSDRLLESVHQKIVDTNADIVIFNHSTLDNFTKFVSEGVHYLSELAAKSVVTPTQISKQIFNTFGNQVWTKAFKRELIEKNKLQFHEELKRAEDIPYTYPAMLLANTIAVIDESLVSYRVNRGSSNSDLLAEHYKDIFQALDMLYAVIKKQKQPSIYQDSFNILFLENIYYNLRSLVGSDRFEEEFNLSKKYMDKFNVSIPHNVQSETDLSELYEVIGTKGYADMLVYMLTKEKKEIADKQTTIYQMDMHIVQLKEAVLNNRKEIVDLKERYTNLKTRYDQVLRIPHKLKRGVRKVKRIFLGEKPN